MTSSENDGQDPQYAGPARGAWLFSRGLAFARTGVAAATIEVALLHENTARCVPPLATEDVRRIAGDAVVYATTEEGHRATALRGFANRPRLLDDGELEQLRPPTFQVEGLLPERGLVLLFAAPGVGKSFLALDWAACIQTGRSWQDREVRAGQVLYVIGEGESGMPVRMRAWKQHHGFEGVAGLLFHLGALDLSNPSEVDRFLEAVISHPNPGFIVIDTVARCLSGDEDSARDMGAFVRGAERLRTELSATVLLLHHPTKKGDGERGSGALRAAVDTVIKLTALKPSGVLRLEVEKQKDGPSSVDIWMSLAPLQVEEGLSSCVPIPALAPQRCEDSAMTPAKSQAKAHAKSQIVSVLNNHPKGLRTSELQAKLPGVKDSTFHRALRELRNQNTVILENDVNRIAGTTTVTVRESE